MFSDHKAGKPWLPIAAAILVVAMAVLACDGAGAPIPVPTNMPGPTDTLKPTDAPTPTPSPTPSPEDLLQQIQRTHVGIVLIQMNAELLTETARRVQAGKLEGSEEGGVILGLTELIQAVEESVPEIDPPEPLSSTWKDAVAIHGQTKDVLAHWLDEDILSPQVVEEMEPVLEDIEAVALEAERIMESKYDFDQKELTERRYEMLEGAMVKVFEETSLKDIYLDQTPAWSPDGSQIAFASNRHDPDPRDCNIYAMDADGSNVIRLTWDPADSLIDHVYPTWSPDGSRIAFASDRGGSAGDYDIHVMDADGSNVTQLTNDPAIEWDPVWSPDGSRIAFVLFTDSYSAAIYTMDADGSNVTRLTDGPASNPAWSPDGSRIAFTSNRDGDSDIYVMDADGSNVVQLTNDPASEYDPTWSPDGSRIAFTSNHDGDSDIYVMDADGSNVVQLTDDPASEYGPTWSPDGSQIAFTSDRDGDRADIYVMDTDGSNVTRLTPVVPD